MVGHLGDVHHKERHCEERTVVECVCATLLQIDPGEQNEIGHSVAPAREPSEESDPAACDVSLQLLLQSDALIKEGPSVGELNAYIEGKRQGEDAMPE